MIGSDDLFEIIMTVCDEIKYKSFSRKYSRIMSVLMLFEMLYKTSMDSQTCL